MRLCQGGGHRPPASVPAASDASGLQLLPSPLPTGMPCRRPAMGSSASSASQLDHLRARQRQGRGERALARKCGMLHVHLMYT